MRRFCSLLKLTRRKTFLREEQKQHNNDMEEKLNTPTRQVELWNESLERYDACFTYDILFSTSPIEKRYRYS